MKSKLALLSQFFFVTNIYWVYCYSTVFKYQHALFHWITSWVMANIELGRQILWPWYFFFMEEQNNVCQLLPHCNASLQFHQEEAAGWDMGAYLVCYSSLKNWEKYSMICEQIEKPWQFLEKYVKITAALMLTLCIA